MKIPGTLATVIRWIAGAPKASQQEDAVPMDKEPAVSDASGFVAAGCFSTREFELLRKRLEAAGIGFRIECDTVAPDINVDGMYCERQTVHVYVHEKETQAVGRIIEGLRLEEGGISPKNS